MWFQCGAESSRTADDDSSMVVHHWSPGETPLWFFRLARSLLELFDDQENVWTRNSMIKKMLEHEIQQHSRDHHQEWVLSLLGTFHRNLLRRRYWRSSETSLEVSRSAWDIGWSDGLYSLVLLSSTSEKAKNSQRRGPLSRWEQSSCPKMTPVLSNVSTNICSLMCPSGSTPPANPAIKNAWCTFSLLRVLISWSSRLLNPSSIAGVEGPLLCHGCNHLLNMEDLSIRRCKLCCWFFLTRICCWFFR